MFSNHPKSKFWSNKNQKKSNEIPLNTHEKFWFDCDKCGQQFYIQLNNINIGLWCPYCANNKLIFFIKSRL
jgi:hypothetical protein